MSTRGPTSDTPTDAGMRPGVGDPVLWFVVASGPVAWTLRLLISYPLAPLACDIGSDWPLHLTTVSMALLAVSGGLLAWRAWRRLPATDGRRTSRAHFMAYAGVYLNAIFLLALLNEGAMPVFQDSCIIPTQDRPRVFMVPPERPLALLTPSPAWAAHGLGPSGGESANGWSLEPVIVLPLLLVSAAYVRGTRAIWRRVGRGRVVTRAGAAAAAGAVSALVVALISPLDAMSAELFSVHMVQHLLLVLVAAPLLVLAAPWTAVLHAFPRTIRRGVARARRHPVSGGLWRTLTRPVAIWSLHTLALWAWHIPALYEAALTSPALHVLEHACFLGTAVLFWGVVRHAGKPGGTEPGVALAVVFVTMLQSTALGAILTLAPEAWYQAHVDGAAARGLTALEDQQLAGLIMWAPAGLAYVVTGATLFLGWLRAAERRVAAREAVRPVPPR